MAERGGAAVRLIFLDDSEQTAPLPRRWLGSLIALGGVVVPHGQLTGYADDLAAIKARLGIPSDEKIKWKPRRSSFQAQAGGPLITQLRQSMLEAAITREIKSVTVVLDHGRAYKRRTVPEVGRTILDWLYDKVAMLLDGAIDSGIMIADKPGGGSAEENRWLADTLRLTNDGTAYSKPGKIILPVLTAASHHVPHLQLADLVVAATVAAVAGRPAGLALAPLLRRVAHENAYGYAGGAGITLWPSHDLCDLHWWLFGEDTYMKEGRRHPLGPAANTDPFVPPGRPYMTHDGLEGQ
jgi:hypothetical protein